MGNDNGDYVLAGFAGNKKASGEIIHVPYVPVMLVETDEERTARVKGERAGKMFASVKLSNEDCRKRGKCGEIVASKVENGKQLHCLNIELINTCSKNGCHTLIGVIKSDKTYKDIWFMEDELENFEKYDENGELIK